MKSYSVIGWTLILLGFAVLIYMMVNVDIN